VIIAAPPCSPPVIEIPQRMAIPPSPICTSLNDSARRENERGKSPSGSESVFDLVDQFKKTKRPLSPSNCIPSLALPPPAPGSVARSRQPNGSKRRKSARDDLSLVSPEASFARLRCSDVGGASLASSSECEVADRENGSLTARRQVSLRLDLAAAAARRPRAQHSRDARGHQVGTCSGRRFA
jgi:hypothetical protein